MCCSVPFCKSRTIINGVKTPGLTFYSFPKCEIQRQKWVKALRRENWEPKEFSRVCSEHFSDECFTQRVKNVTLSHDAVPTIFKDYPSYCLHKSKSPLNIEQRPMSPKKRTQPVEEVRVENEEVPDIENTNMNNKFKLSMEELWVENEEIPEIENKHTTKKQLKLKLRRARILAEKRLKLIRILRKEKRKLEIKNAELTNILIEKEKQLSQKQMMITEMSDTKMLNTDVSEAKMLKTDTSKAKMLKTGMPMAKMLKIEMWTTHNMMGNKTPKAHNMLETKMPKAHSKFETKMPKAHNMLEAKMPKAHSKFETKMPKAHSKFETKMPKAHNTSEAKMPKTVMLKTEMPKALMLKTDMPKARLLESYRMESETVQLSVKI